MTSTASTATNENTRSLPGNRWPLWPWAVGLGAGAAAVFAGVDSDTVATILSIATGCYVAAAATARRWVAWAAIPPYTGIVIGAQLAGIVAWAGVTVATAGVLAMATIAERRRPHSTDSLPRQALAAAVFTGLLTVALGLTAGPALAVAGLALLGHAAWDAVHLWRDRVVSPSLAQACLVLDAFVGAAAVVAAVGMG